MKGYDCTPPVITTSFPQGRTPSTEVMEDMFLINMTPWSAHTNIADYADFLLKQHILLHYRSGTTEVHLLFDDPECQAASPKYFERAHRDKINQTPDDHICVNFITDMLNPSKWKQDTLSCRKCKRNLVSFLSQYLVQHIYYRTETATRISRFMTAGRFSGALQNKALVVRLNTSPLPEGSLTCNAEESDSRIWLHVLNSAGDKKTGAKPEPHRLQWCIQGGGGGVVVAQGA